MRRFLLQWSTFDWLVRLDHWQQYNWTTSGKKQSCIDAGDRVEQIIDRWGCTTCGDRWCQMLPLSQFKLRSWKWKAHTQIKETLFLNYTFHNVYHRCAWIVFFQWHHYITKHCCREPQVICHDKIFLMQVFSNTIWCKDLMFKVARVRLTTYSSGPPLGGWRPPSGGPLSTACWHWFVIHDVCPHFFISRVVLPGWCHCKSNSSLLEHEQTFLLSTFLILKDYFPQHTHLLKLNWNSLPYGCR